MSPREACEAAILAQLGAAEVATRVAQARAAHAAEMTRREAATLPPGPDDAAAARWARRPGSKK